jgi:NAD-dependent deacetylase
LGKILDNQIPKEVISKLEQAQNVVIFTGAGISASAKLPTLSGPDCTPIWEFNFIADLLSAEKITGKSVLHLRLLDDLLTKTRAATPTAAHLALAKLAINFPSFHIITQNFDDLHQRASGTNINSCLMLHGGITKSRCLKCNTQQLIETSYKEHWKSKCLCGGDWRTDILLFDEVMSEDLWQSAENLAENTEIFISIGSSGEVLPGGLLPAIARRRGAFLIEFNLTTTEITPHFHFTILGASDNTVVKLDNMINQI